MALEILSPASDGKLLFLFGQGKLVFLRVGAVVRAVKDHGVAPLENGPVDRFESLALPPGARARAFHERRAKAGDDRHDMGHAGDLGGGDADGSVACGIPRQGREDWRRSGSRGAEFPHAAILVPKGKLRRQRTGLGAEVRQTRWRSSFESAGAKAEHRGLDSPCRE